MAGIKYWIQKGSFSLVSRILIFLFGFLTYLLLVRYLEKAEFGIYVLYLTIVTLLEMGRKSFLQNAFTKFYHKEEHPSINVVNSTLTLNLAWTVIAAAILMVSSKFIGDLYDSELLGQMLFFYSIFTFVQVPNSLLTFYYAANMKFKNVTILTNARNFIFFILVAYVFFFVEELNVLDIIWLNLYGIVGGTLISFFLFPKSIKWKFVFDFDLIKQMFHFGKYTLGIGLNAMITRSIDQLMIGYFISAEAVASYNIARRFLNIFDVPITSISHVTYPKMAKTLGKSNFRLEVSKLYSKSSGYSMAAIMPVIILLMAFPAFFISLIAGDDSYLDAVPVLQILLLLTVLKPMSLMSGNVLEIVDKQRLGFLLLFMNTIINIGLNYIFINLDGFYGGSIGASIASFIARFIHITLLAYYLSKEINFSIKDVFYNILAFYQTMVDVMRSKLLKR